MPSAKPVKQSRRPYTFGPLYDFLSARFPEQRSKQNVFDIPGFAAELGYAHETLYKAVRQHAPLKIGVALSILKLSRENQHATPIYWDDLIEYMLPEFETYSRSSDKTEDDIDDLLA